MITPKGERVKIFFLGLITIGEGVVQVLSLGYLNPSWRAWLLFSVYE